MTLDTEEKMLRDALFRQRPKEILEPAEADPLYSVSREAVRRTAARSEEVWAAGAGEGGR